MILSHQHLDHLGLVSLVAATRAPRWPRSTPRSRSSRTSLESRRTTTCSRDDAPSGISEDVAIALQSVSRAFRAWGARVTWPGAPRRRAHRAPRPDARGRLSARTLADRHGVLRPPAAILLAADHLLGHISSNPLITRPPDGSSRRPQALVRYLESLRETRAMDIDLVLPGHGDPITDHRALIDERLRCTGGAPARSTVSSPSVRAPLTRWLRRSGATSPSPRHT